MTHNAPHPQRNHFYLGDCRQVLADFAPESVDLIVTSPPYADRRKDTYGGVEPDQYVAWFLPIADELHRVLKPTGSFVLNIKERVVNGERHTYVIELILALRQHGWLWTEEYCWHKRNSFPGKWPNRFRDSWERLLHFTKQRQFTMYQDAVMVPVGDWADSRLRNLSDTDKERDESKVNSGFGKKVANWVGRDMVYPTNVLHMATECANRAHSAVFPVALPAWFIKLFTLPGDLVLDPFMGSGTTAVAAKSLGRDYVGIDMMEEYVREAEQRVQAIQPALADVMTYELPSEEASPDARQVYTLRLCEREDCDLS
jgi:site-specific DNA-methyltransferase (adenine-specific)/site-specific DNA-methyltransferase (cytosine-N4-specific)